MSGIYDNGVSGYMNDKCKKLNQLIAKDIPMTNQTKLEAIRKASGASTAKQITLEHIFMAYSKTKHAIKLPLTISERGDLAWGMADNFCEWKMLNKLHEQDQKTIDLIYNLCEKQQ